MNSSIGYMGQAPQESSSGFYDNQLKKMLTNPSSFQGTPGFKFALGQGTEAVNRRMAAGGMGESGNALAKLMEYGTGLAQQDYGNQMDRLGRLSGQDQQFTLGQGQNANTAMRNQHDYNLGQGQLDLGYGQLGQAALKNQNDYNLAQGRNGIDWYNAQTGRGSAMSNSWLNNNQNNNSFSLGQGQNQNQANQIQSQAHAAQLAAANSAQRNANDYALGQDQNALQWQRYNDQAKLRGGAM